MSRFRSCVLGMLLVLLVLLGAASTSMASLSSPVSFSSRSFSSHPMTVIPFTSSRVIGSPSLSAAFVDRVLAVYHSPAVGLGQALYADSRQFQIDDAYALAFFLKESTFGTTGVARVTHSLGNIKCTAGWPRCYEGFRWYASFVDGAWDWFRLIRAVYIPQGLDTVESIVPVYAPASDGNDPAAYIATVLHAVATWRAGRIWV
jgi:hypothetical protein